MTGCGKQRLVVAVMGFFVTLTAYTQRLCLSVAITEMVIIPVGNTSETIENELNCPNTNGELNTTQNAFGEFLWDEEMQGIILSSFYWGYALTPIPGGLAAQRFGPKYIMGFGILLSSIFTLLSPISCRYGGATILILVRFIAGLCQGPLYPSLAAILTQWVPEHERGTLGAIAMTGHLFGTVASSAVSGLLIDATQTWDCVFYFFGILGIFCFLTWTMLCYNTPEDHPCISVEEREMLIRTINRQNENKESPVPWKEMALSGPVWGFMLCMMGHDFGLHVIVLDLPKYMKDVLKFNISQNGLLTSLPYLGQFIISLICGKLSDKVISSKILSTTNARKIFNSIGVFSIAVGVVGASYTGCSRVAAVACFVVGLSLEGAVNAGIALSPLDISPTYAASVMAISSCLAALTGIVAPYLIGVLTPDRTLLQWRSVFWITAAILCISNLLFVLLGSAKVQSWNNPRKRQRANSENSILLVNLLHGGGVP